MQGFNAPGTPQNPAVSTDLKRKISFFGLTMIAAGACIGSGIFITPSDIAYHLGNVEAILFVWGLGGVVAITGSLTFAELAGRFPAAGGVYVFIRECYGRIWAFLYGWCILTVITSGAIAGLALIFARYLSVLIPLSQTGQIVVSITVILSVSIVNILGVKPGELFSSILTLLKFLGIAGIVVVGVFIGSQIQIPDSVSGSPSTYPHISAFALAMIGVIWSYGGWHHASYVAGETKNAVRIVPWAMIIGALIVTVSYVLTNFAYIRLLPLEAIASSPTVASDALRTVVPAGGVVIAVLICVSTFGSICIYTLTAPRIYYSMAADGSFFKALAQVHPRYHTPAWAIVTQSGWAILLLVFWATFENLITYVVFMDWLFMTLAALTIFYFRRQAVQSQYSGFRTPAFPVIPVIFIAISLWFIIYTLIGKPAQAWAGIILLTIGLPVYYFNRRRRNE
jgi:APA family basic amino acid/polyamine antiporter